MRTNWLRKADDDLPGGAKRRLGNIRPVEVSFVDRAANKRTFLVVKRDGGAIGPALSEGPGGQLFTVGDVPGPGGEDEMNAKIDELLKKLDQFTGTKKDDAAGNADGQDLGSKLGKLRGIVAGLEKDASDAAKAGVAEALKLIDELTKTAGQPAGDLAKEKAAADGKGEPAKKDEGKGDPKAAADPRVDKLEKDVADLVAGQGKIADSIERVAKAVQAVAERPVTKGEPSGASSEPGKGEGQRVNKSFEELDAEFNWGHDLNAKRVEKSGAKK